MQRVTAVFPKQNVSAVCALAGVAAWFAEQHSRLARVVHANQGRTLWADYAAFNIATESRAWSARFLSLLQR